MDMQDPMRSFERGKAQRRNRMRTDRYACFEILEQLIAYIFPYILLSFFGRAPDMRSKNDIGKVLKRRFKSVAVLFGFPWIHIHCGSHDLPIEDRLPQGLQVNHL